MENGSVHMAPHHSMKCGLMCNKEGNVMCIKWKCMPHQMYISEQEQEMSNIYKVMASDQVIYSANNDIPEFLCSTYQCNDSDNITIQWKGKHQVLLSTSVNVSKGD